MVQSPKSPMGSSNALNNDNQNIKVAVRVRDVLKPSSLKLGENNLAITDKKSTKDFAFDKVFHKEDTSEIYTTLLQPMVSKSLDGFNSSIFAYGQTSGKYHLEIQLSNSRENVHDARCQRRWAYFSDYFAALRTSKERNWQIL